MLNHCVTSRILLPEHLTGGAARELHGSVSVEVRFAQARCSARPSESRNSTEAAINRAIGVMPNSHLASRALLNGDFRPRGIIRAPALCVLCRYRHKTHWTRHASRLDRDLGRKRFADAGYAMEELVAEIGAAFLCAATSRRQSASRNRQAQMIFAKAAAPALPSSFGHRLGFSATTADTAAKASRPLPKIASILLTQTETSSFARR
jgi:hypothetical protein